MPAKSPLKLIILRIVLGLCGLAALTIIAFQGVSLFTGGPKISHRVLATAGAPGGKLKAVLTLVTGSNPSDFGYVVDVVATATDSDTARVANVHADKEVGAAVLKMTWTDSRTLLLRATHGAIAQKEPGDVTVAGQPVTVLLR